MKKARKILLILLVLVLLSSLSACGDSKVIEGVQYDTYGLISESSTRNPGIRYALIVGNLVWGIILVETIIAPIYFFGYSLFEPIEKINPQPGPP